MNGTRNTLRRAEQPISHTQSHDHRHLQDQQNDPQKHQQHTEKPPTGTTQPAIRTTSDNSLATLYSTGTQQQNSNPEALHTLACLPNRSGGAPGGALAVGRTGGAQ